MHYMETYGLCHALLAIGLLQLYRLGLASAITCSYGKEEQIPITDGEVLNLRQGETLIFNCIGEPEHHLHLTLRYNEEPCYAETNTTTLEYTWYCVIDGDGLLKVWGIDKDHNTNDPLITINITSYDPANPCATMEPTVSSSTTASSGVGRAGGQNQPDQQSTEEPVATAANFYFIGALIILCVFVLALFVTVLVMAVVIQRMKHKPPLVEDGKTGYTQEDHDCYSMQTRDAKSRPDHADHADHAESTADMETENQRHSPTQDHTDQVDVTVDSDDSVMDSSTTYIT